MSQLGALALKMRLNPARQSFQHGVRVEGPSVFQLRRAVQPAEQRLALRVQRIIDFHRRAGDLFGGGNTIEPCVQPGALPR